MRRPASGARADVGAPLQHALQVQLSTLPLSRRIELISKIYVAAADGHSERSINRGHFLQFRINFDQLYRVIMSFVNSAACNAPAAACRAEG